MAVNATVVRLIKETYTRAELVTKRAAIAAEILAGVQVSQVTFEGGGASGRPTMTPAEIGEIIQAAIDLHDDEDSLAKPRSASIDLSQRCWGT
jgi:hypothetical protein